MDSRRLTDNGSVELSEPITLEGQRILCRTGNSLAMRFLAAARDAVILGGAALQHDLAWRVEEALAAMLVHRAKCRECAAAELLAAG